MLRQTLLADAEKVLREYRERTCAAPPPAELAPAPPPLLTRARAFLTHHLAEPPALFDTLILWSLHTHAHARFDVSPRLILHGRDPRADHARALRVLRWLTPSPRLVARATAANVLDLIAHESPTLLLDDAANTILARRDMRVLIAAGAYTDGALLGKRTREGRRRPPLCHTARDRNRHEPTGGGAGPRHRSADGPRVGARGQGAPGSPTRPRKRWPCAPNSKRSAHS